jgi:hypothetical protein
VVDGVAFAGSDPYLREGSDLTAVFQVRLPTLFYAALDGMLALHGKTHALRAPTTIDYEGTRIALTTSADGAVRQHRATVGDLAIVSNSLSAMKRLLDAAGKRRARLSDEKDFRYMLAQGADVHLPVLFFFGDRFVEEVTGPRQKILEARRQVAAAELMTPGFAALLHGWVFGKSAASVDELVSTKLLRKEELKHANGDAIDWRPGRAARSTWGTPSSLTPLIDLLPPDAVSESERAAYDRFSRTYETYWSRYIDPAAAKLGVGAGSKPELTADLRVLPLIDGTDYAELIELAGRARVSAAPLDQGLRAVVGIGAAARVRQELAGLASHALGRHAFKLDFLGDWAMAGVADRKRIASVVEKLDTHLPQAPESEPSRRVDEIVEAARIPAYAAVEIKSASGAALALAAVRAMAEETLRGMLTWGDVGTEHGTTIFRVALGDRREDPSDANGRSEVVLFYALTDKAFLVALDESVLRGLVADLAAGRGPVAQREKAAGDGSQLVFDLSSRCEGGLHTVLGWLLAEQLVRASGPAHQQAEALLRGAPELAGPSAADRAALRALSLAYFGSAPVPPHGGAYALGADGVRDPVLGTASSPEWPALPVPGSMIERVQASLGQFRSEIAFDDEGGAARTSAAGRSLHVRTVFGSCRP